MATCKELYERLSHDRESFLSRARQCSEYTIPTLIPPGGHNSATKFNTPWQSVGARGVNNLASKLLLSLLPPNSPFFKLQVDDFTAQELAQREDARSSVDEALNKIERAVMSDMESNGMRSPIFLALKNLIVGGNVLLYLPPGDGVRVYRLDSYVVERDPLGNVLQVVARDVVSPDVLTDEERKLLDPDPEQPAPSAEQKREKTVEVYTRLYRENNNWKLYQELNGKQIEGSTGSYPIDRNPMIPLRWTSIDGEDYGRSYVEEYLGDIISLENLSKAIVQGSAIAAKVVVLVKPNGVTKVKSLAEAENGDIITGQEDDVYTLQSQKQADLSIAHQTAQSIQERLAMAFLMNSAIQRNAERVTAEEIRFMAGELEDALGGVYSILSQELQLPLVNRIMDRMTRAKKLPELPKGVIKPAIVTGLEALGRGHDLNKYDLFIQRLQGIPPEKIDEELNFGDYIKRVGTALGIDMNGLIYSEEQKQQRNAARQQQQQQMMLAEMANKGIPNAVKGIADAANAGAASPAQ